MLPIIIFLLMAGLTVFMLVYPLWQGSSAARPLPAAAAPRASAGKCATCGRALEPDERFCPQCGTPAGLRCPQCGRALAGDERFCPGCGTKLEGSR
jgi:RNA polymerase subunit RPABC4/transcription elongation factor Spt4